MPTALALRSITEKNNRSRVATISRSPPRSASPVSNGAAVRRRGESRRIVFRRVAVQHLRVAPLARHREHHMRPRRLLADDDDAIAAAEPLGMARLPGNAADRHLARRARDGAAFLIHA